MAERHLAQWLRLLESRHPCEIELGLDRVAEVWRRIQAQQSLLAQKLPVAITVAGTNGKGSCIASMQALLLEHGYSVAMFTSPHFLTYNERICLAGKPVADEVITGAFERIEEARGNLSLSYFEFGTLAALVIFQQACPDVMLLEVGLGGRLDAVNIIDADVAVLTSVALDHQNWLGDTRSAIAREKLGIARPNRPLVIGEQDFPWGFGQMIAETGANALLMGDDFSYQCCSGDQFTAHLAAHPACGTGELVFDQLSGADLLPCNKVLALQALLCAGIELNLDKSRRALQSVNLLGRQQRVVYQGINVLLDVAHNPAAAEMLAISLEPIEGKTIAVASVLDDKDWSAIACHMKPVIDKWMIAEISDSSRASKGQLLLELLYNSGQSGILHESVAQAFSKAINEATHRDRIVVFGSFHTVAAVLNIILPEV